MLLAAMLLLAMPRLADRHCAGSMLHGRCLYYRCRPWTQMHAMLSRQEAGWGGMPSSCTLASTINTPSPSKHAKVAFSL